LQFAGWRWLLALGALGAVFVLFCALTARVAALAEATGRHRETGGAAASRTLPIAAAPKIVIFRPRAPPRDASNRPLHGHWRRRRHRARTRRLGMLAVFHLLQPSATTASAGWRHSAHRRGTRWSIVL